MARTDQDILRLVRGAEADMIPHTFIEAMINS
jgi:hypothetical protein